ncbi:MULTISPECIES: cation:proton antiporter [unclassified Coleofasciculus]|uniref:cation:proton antiporter n=1 Tax=Cyanophyceae TaxID=3028117 RepID=UPI0016876733|nr:MULTISPECIES: cation:proton antiporter [unclassified Coleofasciculus]MBD1878707.1 cation:proton antiporter [Coleofasciculus sp. FACHB-T130]MBD1894398.1 cation:proton antiporter [Coleofasciculus sp. FACHB-129]MBD1903020.1 cation:proton antiporter [Coleofasciculus sp. FACHB-125]MBD2541627.1 cation:proton antiporter [Coleofasciculus sp. FACHB-SPT36]
METSFELTLQIVITVVAGISAQVLAQYLQVPSIVFLLLFGILLGPDGLRLLHPHSLGTGLEVITALAVAVILFEGGLNLELRELGKVSGSLRNLVTLGTLITLLGGGMAAHWLGEFPWPIAFLYASLVVVTGPTVISPLLKQVQVDRQVAALLEGEGVLIDPVGAILAVVVLDTILNADTDPIEAFIGLVLRLGIGGGIGVVGGWLMGWIIKRAKFLSEDLNNLVVLAGLWGLFGLAQTIRSESGLMATVMAGIVLGASSIPEERMLRRFKGQLTILGVSVLFILLAADLSIASVFALGWGSLFTVLALMFIVRPINIGLCTFNSDLNWRQKLFLCWIAPRGIVSASVASLFAIFLTQRGINGGDSIKALVFLTIILTVFLQGLTARWVARWLQINLQEATGAVIIGCNPLSRLIARLFQEQGESVVLIDTDPEACQKAEQENLRVFLSSGLDTEVLEEAGLDSMGTFLAMTNNGEVNLVLAQRASEEFRPPRVLAVFPQANTPTNNSKVHQAFIPNLSIKNWNQYLNDGQVKLGKTSLKEPGFSFQQAHLQALIRSGELVPLLFLREGRFQVVPATEDWEAGDQIIYVLHDPRPKLLKRLSGASPSSRLALEKLPEVEEVPISSASVGVLLGELKPEPQTEPTEA